MNYQNTYRLEPHSPFNRDKCDTVLKEVIDAAMEEYQYNPKLANTFCSNLAEEIRKRIKELSFDRYIRDSAFSIAVKKLCPFPGTSSFAQ